MSAYSSITVPWVWDIALWWVLAQFVKPLQAQRVELVYRLRKTFSFLLRDLVFLVVLSLALMEKSIENCPLLSWIVRWCNLTSSLFWSLIWQHIYTSRRYHLLCRERTLFSQCLINSRLLWTQISWNHFHWMRVLLHWNRTLFARWWGNKGVCFFICSCSSLNSWLVSGISGLVRPHGLLDCFFVFLVLLIKFFTI